MNALGEVCPVCGGRMRQSQYALICAQEFGPCGLLYHKFSGRNRQGGKTEFNHTRLGKPPLMVVRNASLKVCFGGGGLISEDVFSARLNGEQEPPRKAPPGKRAIVIRQAITEQIRAGVCPECGNDRCMADGVTGLWCPACDASYLLSPRPAGGPLAGGEGVEIRGENGPLPADLLSGEVAQVDEFPNTPGADAQALGGFLDSDDLNSDAHKPSSALV